MIEYSKINEQKIEKKKMKLIFINAQMLIMNTQAEA